LFRCRDDSGKIFPAELDSYGRVFLVPLLPVAEFDFGCRDPLFGGELTLQKARLDPAGEPVVVIANRAEPWLIQP